MMLRVVGGLDILMAPSQLPCIQRENQHVESAVPSPIQKGKREFVVMRHVKLEEARTVAVCLSDIFNRLAASSTDIRELKAILPQTVWQVQFAYISA